MKIHYHSSIRGKGKGLWGLPQKINWQFEYAGTKRCIPVIYRFSKGIVFDVITILDETKLRDFFQKYEALEESLTPIQKRCVEEEHPYQAVPINQIWINGKKVEGGYSSSGTISIPWEKESDVLTSVKKAYPSILKDSACFACERYCVPYPEADGKVQKLLRFLRLERVDKIKLATYPVDRFLPLDIHFKMSVDEKQKEVCFDHPITGIKHTIHFQNPELIEFPMEAAGTRCLFVMQVMYEIEPALMQGDRLQFNSSIQYTEPQNDQRFSPAAAASIGIIGGADGPTAIFCASKREKSHRCFSVPSFQREAISHFILEGINIKNRDSEEFNY